MTTEFLSLLDETLDRLMRPFSDGTERFASPKEAFNKSSCWPRMLEAGLHLPEFLEDADKIPALLSIARASGYHFISAPAWETLLTNLVFEKADLPVSKGTASFCRLDIERVEPAASGKRVWARATNVPWGGQAEILAGVAEHERKCYVMTIPANKATITPRMNLADEPRDDVALDGFILENGVFSVGNDKPLYIQCEFLALVRAAQMVGAMKRVAELTADHMQQREQFGKKLTQFQVLRQNFASLVTEIAIADAAVSAGGRRFEKGGGGPNGYLWGAVAKILACDAAHVCFKVSHQLHGAIGFTTEYVLSDLSKRLLSWRDDFGGRDYWAAHVGRAITAPGAARPWPFLTEL